MSDKIYVKLLDKALSKLPKNILKKDRFESPKPTSSVMGNRTILYNIKEISDKLRRKKEDLLKYLSKELATASNIDGTHVIFQGRFDNLTLKKIIERYTNDYVYCPICHRPDTKITKEDRYTFLLCEACGAKSSIKSNY